MFKGTPYSNKIIKRRQQQRLLQIHKQNLRGIRPLTNPLENDGLYDPTNIIINNKKKDMLQQDRFTEIQRQNRMLLEKINSIMSKKPSFKNSVEKVKRKQSIAALGDKHRMNKSLNQGFRKKQLEGIQIQNAKLLKRLQQKKSDYQAKKLKQQWKQQKKVIKNLANYPFIIRDKIFRSRRKSSTSQSFHMANGYPYTPNPTNLTAPVQLVRIRNLNNNNFLLTIKFDSQTGLQIMGDNKSTKQIKIIQIPKQQAIQFIQYECDGKLELLFDCLKYDQMSNVLFLVGKGVDIGVKEQKNQDNEEDDQVNKQQSKDRQNANLQKINVNSQNPTQQNINMQPNKNLSNILEQQAQQSHLKTQNNRKTQVNLTYTQQKLEKILQTQQKPELEVNNQKKQRQIQQKVQANEKVEATEKVQECGQFVQVEQNNIQIHEEKNQQNKHNDVNQEIKETVKQ